MGGNKEMKRAVVIALCLALSLCVVGCGSGSGSGNQSTGSTQSEAPKSEADTSKPSELEILEVGYNVNDSGYVLYGIGIHNPNTDFEVEYPTIVATGKDDAGKIVFSSEQVMGTIYPGMNYYYATQAGNGTAPATVEFSIKTNDRNWTKSTRTSADIYDIANTNEVIGSYGLDNYTGEITLVDDSITDEGAWISVIFRDAAGSIVGGNMGFADSLSPGATSPFDVSAYSTPEHATYEIHAVPWF